MTTLSEGRWVLGGGLSPEWGAVLGLRVKEGLGALKKIRELLARDSPQGLRPFRIPEAMERFLAAASPARDRLVLFPAFDCWLSLSKTFLAGVRPSGDFEAHFPFFQCFAAALAASGGGSLRLRVRLTSEARFHVTGTGEYFEFPPSEAGQEAVCQIEGGAVRVLASRGREGRRRQLAQVRPTLWVDFRDPLILQPIYVHAYARPDAEGEARFAAVLSMSLERIRRLEPALFSEIEDFLRVLVPLENPAGYGSVSSSYQNLRGALCLSHAEDVLLQEETLIHEFCHQKLNLLLAADPLLEPGQSAQVFYSPLRPDARRLQGLLLGAHAFINVCLYILRVLECEELPAERQDDLRRVVARRLFQVEDMLRTLSGYATATPFGARLLARMWRELMLLYHRTQGFPPALIEDARRLYREHRAQHALSETGLYGQKVQEAVHA